MSEKRFNPYPAMIVGGALLLLAYGTAYLATAQLGAMPRFGTKSEQSGYDPFYADNPRVNSILDGFFGPVHELDRRLRPQFWHVEPPPSGKPFTHDG